MSEYSRFVLSLAKSLPTEKERLYHASLGLIGEIGEIADCWKKHTIYEQGLDFDNMLEELGDLRFYIQMILNEPRCSINHDFEYYYQKYQLENNSFDDALFHIVGDVADFLNCLQHELQLHAFWILIRFNYLCSLVGFTEEKVIQANMKKLTIRYPNAVFTAKHAAERLDKTNAQN